VARGGTSSAPAAPLPDDDDMLREILIRLPPQPSSLPRASAVCKRWRGLVTDPKFRRQFYAHHRKPPLLGAFVRTNQGTEFAYLLSASTLDTTAAPSVLSSIAATVVSSSMRCWRRKR
jgi:hypothetical protein